MCTTILAIITCIVFYAMIKMQQNWKLIVKHLKQEKQAKTNLNDKLEKTYGPQRDNKLIKAIINKQKEMESTSFND